MNRLAAVLAMGCACAAAPAWADGYSPEWCAANRDNDRMSRLNCADAPWCKAHWNDDRETRVACDAFRSKADASLPMPHMTRATLDMGPKLTRGEAMSRCFAGQECGLGQPYLVGRKPREDTDETMLPPGVPGARLALRGDIAFGNLPIMHVRIALMNGREGVLWINGSPYGPHQARLGPAEISSVVDAINRSQFWRLPAHGGHMSPADGMISSIEIAVPGRRRHVTDSTNPKGGVDLSVLTHAITPIVFAHWKGI